ncbi:MAG: hypothetical protein SH856_08075 [Flavobacteriales bacterium]|nr:hypothetical protein [Flavobacteriales bacterium]
MNNNKLFLGLLLGLVAGGLGTYFVTGTAHVERDSAIQKALDDIRTDINEMKEGEPLEFLTMESAPVTQNYADNLIRNYCAGNTRLKTHDQTTLKGWFIEKSFIEQLFIQYADQNPTGLTLYLGKHNEADNRSHTLLWMACKDVPDGSGGTTTELLLDRPNSIYQYVKPCPPNCPRIDLATSCN